MNLLDDPILTLSSGEMVSLPGLFAAMTHQEAHGFPALRPHQRPAWHMFLVQLGALAVSGAGFESPPDDATSWRKALRALTPKHPDDSPWLLATPNLSRPAFLQPPTSDNLSWKPVSSPDDLDMLITARNHDVKRTVARNATAEDWVYALVSLQTCEGYGGRGKYGIARMNGGSSSRTMVALAPASGRDLTANPSAWWHRDVSILTKSRRRRATNQLGRVGGPSLLWCLDWPEGEQLDLRDLDPWFIEICRRVRLTESRGELSACHASSKAARIDAKVFKGNVGDPWAPVHRKKGKSFTLGSGKFDYKRLVELLFSGDWSRPLLSSPAADERGDMLLVAEAFARGNSKTDGFQSRVVAAPGEILSLFASKTVATFSKAQMDEIAKFSKALRFALALVAAHGDHNLLKGKGRKSRQYFKRTDPACDRFERLADRQFFPSLWQRVATEQQDTIPEASPRLRFLQYLLTKAENELEFSIPSIPCPATLRPRSEARARRAFKRQVRIRFPELFEMEKSNVAT